ncbi:MAG: MerR family transcriptional regulator [Lachnospiraceae bacterium]|nr:MerR family transcriptional regulator [Lachnospiraceae bacterium]
MAEYLSIGKVSKLKNVSIKSLRYYDELGIYRPAYINPKTNYRYYTRQQLPLLDAISLCIEIGIPLKDFDRYKDERGNVDLHRLLCDGKNLAEEKIKAMGRRLETLSQTIEELENQKDQPVFPVKKLPVRHVLTIPFDEDTSASHYAHRLLSLFVQAQKLGLKASYPSGFLYEQKGGNINRYVFLMLDSGKPSSLTLPDEYAIFTLKAGHYYYLQEQSHQIEQAAELFARIPEAGGDCLFIESDLLQENEVNKFELQLLQLN